MKLIWEIDQKDIDRIREFVNGQRNAFIDRRVSRNLNREGLELNRNEILRTILMCLLTSQQRSGPNTPVGRFLLHHPNAFSVEKLSKERDLRHYVIKTLLEHDLRRCVNNIANYFVTNYNWLESDNWEIMDHELKRVILPTSKEIEREVAMILAKHLKGIGPKQARNFLQSLGLIRFEIPIDSRITNWLNAFGFPVDLSSSALQDPGYYHFISDGIQELCRLADLYPCILDAAIFTSFDNGEWNEDNVIY